MIRTSYNFDTSYSQSAEKHAIGCTTIAFMKYAIARATIAFTKYAIA
jgi:hypothetical protein